MLFPTLCVDGFFQNPDQAVSIAKQCPMNRTSDRPGTRSPCLSTVNIDFYNYVNTKILRIFYPQQDFSYIAHTHFQSTFPDENTIDSWVHTDEDYMLTAIVYLNHCNVGTSIFTRKDEFTIPQFAGDIKHNYFANYESIDRHEREKIEKIREEINSQYDESVNIRGKYNRFMCFDGNSYHTIQKGSCDEERLILISFIKDVRLMGTKTIFPVTQMNSL
jgi:hypothetical protein